MERTQVADRSRQSVYEQDKHQRRTGHIIEGFPQHGIVRSFKCFQVIGNRYQQSKQNHSDQKHSYGCTKQNGDKECGVETGIICRNDNFRHQTFNR